MFLEETRKRLLTVGKDRVVKVTYCLIYSILLLSITDKRHLWAMMVTVPPIMTKRTTTSHLNWTQKKPMTYDFGKPNPDPLYYDIEILKYDWAINI